MLRMLALIRDWGDERQQRILKHLVQYASIDIVQVRLSKIQKYTNYLKTISSNKNVWRERSKKNVYSYKSFSKNIAHEIKKKFKGKYDYILQLEGLYSPGTGENICRPYVIYEDSTSMLARKQWAAWVPDTMRTDEYFELEKNGYKNAEIIFTASEATRTSLIEDYGVHASKVHTVFHGSNLEYANISIQNKNKQQLIFVGYDFQRKGGYVLLNAFKKLNEKHPKSTLKIIGSDIKITSKGIHIINKISDRKELKNLYEESMIFVLPSFAEGFAISMVEAMGSKCAVVVTHDSGGSEIIKDGINGYLVKAGDEQELYEKLESLVKDSHLAMKMGEANYKIVNEILNWEVIARIINTKLSALLTKNY